MAGLDPAIHVFCLTRKESKTWITGTSPVMTVPDQTATDLIFKQRRHPPRHCERSEAIHAARKKVWIASSLALLAMTDTRPRSRGATRPNFARFVRPLEKEGVGNAGCQAHPQPRVRMG